MAAEEESESRGRREKNVEYRAFASVQRSTGRPSRCGSAIKNDELRATKSRVSLEDAEDELEAIAASAFPAPTRGDLAAEAMGLSVGTINTHMRLANKDLRTAFTRAGFRIENFQPAQLLAPKGDATND